MSKVKTKKDKKQNKNQSNVFTKETLGVVLVLFATLALVCLITREKVFSVIGLYINAFLLGVFGYFAFAVTIFGVIYGVLLITDKKIGLSRKQSVFLTLAFISLTLFLHLLSMGKGDFTYGSYLAESYLKGDGGLSASSAGGVMTALFAYFFHSLLTMVGGCVITGLAFGACVFFLVYDIVKKGNFKRTEKSNGMRSSYVPTPTEKDMDVQIAGEKDYPVSDAVFNENSGSQRLFINNPSDFHTKSKKEMAKSESLSGIKLDFSANGLSVGNTNSTYSASYQDDLKKKIEYVKTPAKIDLNSNPYGFYSNIGVSKPIEKKEEKPQELDVKPELPEIKEAETPAPEVKAIPLFEHDGDSEISDDATGRALRFRDKYAMEDFPSNSSVQAEPTETFIPLDLDRDDKKEEEVSQDFKAEIQEETFEPEPEITESRTRRILFNETESADSEVVNAENTPPERPNYTSRVGADGNGELSRGRFASRLNPIEDKPQEVEPEKPKKPAPPINRKYFRPPLDLLETHTSAVDPAEEGHEERMEIIQRTLEEFHINAVTQSYIQGPAITRYEVMMPAGISVKNVLRYDDDLKMRLSSKSGVRIEAPIPGKNLVGVEVANKHPIPVGLREVLEGAADQKVKPDALVFAIGKNLVGKSVTDNLAKGPHYLVAGATGSGKSVCLNVMIVSLIMRYSPEELRLILVDPKRVGFRCYEHIPHLLIDEIITEPQKAVAALAWAYNEMERRYKLFEDCDGYVSDIGAYNEQIASDTVPKLPRIVIVVDELADLMESCKKDMEARIRALAAKARAAGVHLVLATQRPSVDVITGTIKANLPSRIALKVMNFADSSTILSEGGAEKLLGNGDMLYKNSGMSECERYQGAWISDREINNVVKYIKEHNEAYFDDDLKEFLEKSMRPNKDEGGAVSTADGGEDDDGVNEFFLKALWLAVVSGTVSISQLQRRFQIGYARAGGLVDKMERMGFVSGNEGSKARRVLLTKEDYEDRFGPAPDTY